MKFGVVTSFGTVRDYVGMAREAEAPGWDGVVAEVAAWMAAHREASGPFDIVIEGLTSGTDHDADREMLEPIAAAGATWFIESRWEDGQSAETVRERIRRGSPRL